jgi:anti-sigma regulatory factor (Ser/Thr protein kinase)
MTVSAGKRPRSAPHVLEADTTSGCRLIYNSPMQGESALILLRSRLMAVATRMGFPEARREGIALAASEMATNLIKHAGGRGTIQIWQQPGPVLDLFALDFGPGIGNTRQAQRDGYSTANTLGHGLGSIERLSDHYNLYSLPEQARRQGWSGTAVLARFRLHKEEQAGLPRLGLYSQGLADERVNGDRICLRLKHNLLRWMHLDGLGHGNAAHDTVARLPCDLFDWGDPSQLLAALDRQLSGTRGAVGLAAELDIATGSLFLTGVGDMHAHQFQRGELLHFAFAPGVLGREHRLPVMTGQKLQAGDLIITASDGIRRNWDAHSFPGLFRQPPQLIAYLLGNIMGRLSDDHSLCVIALPDNNKSHTKNANA